jgi:uncharacterized protein (DUF1330 family)
METYVSPSPEQMTRIQNMELDGPVVIVNLLRFRPDGGEEEFGRYSAEASPHLQNSGAKLRYLGDVVATLVGGGDETWDRVIMVEYPSKEAVLDMTGSSDYPGEIRDDALLDSRVYCTQEVPYTG